MKLLGAAALFTALMLVTGEGRPHPGPLPRHFVQGALCIHSHEGSWTDPDAPYWGGMQMDLGFQRTYGTWLLKNVGTADKWTPHQQLHVSYRAYSGWKGFDGRGWWPWPNTARKCGLI